MKERFNNRIKTYILLSVVILLVFNMLSVMHSIQVIEKYIEYNKEYTAVEFKNAYEDVFEFDEYYTSNFSEYSRHHVSQWYKIIDEFYQQTEGDVLLREKFYTYLDDIDNKTSINVEIINIETLKKIYPIRESDEDAYFNTSNLDEIKKTLYNDGNVLYESLNDTKFKTSKIVKRADETVISVSYTAVPSELSPLLIDQKSHLSDELEQLADKEESIYGYYVLNSKNEVLFTNQEQLEYKVLTLKGAKQEDLLTHQGQYTRINYAKKFYLNDEVFVNHSIHLVPLHDGNRVMLILDDTTFIDSINKIKFMAILVSLVGVLVLYIIGSVIMYVIKKSELTARRVTRSSQINRMIILMFVILVLLNGMAIIQISKILFFDGYEKESINSMDKYITYIERKEDGFKQFIEMIREDAIIESELIYKGFTLFSTENNERPETIDSVESVARNIEESIKTNGYYEYYKAPKLLYENDFDSFYENYVLETMIGDNLHAIEHVMIYPNKKGDGYIRMTKNISEQMILISRLRSEFKDVCSVDEKELFISNITIYNDAGTVVVAQNGQEKITSRKLNDELSNYPLWYWYQFRHNELFRTVVKTVEGNYNEQYSLVGYSEPLEYYFVYNIERRTLFLEMERLYNIYVSAIMFLLVSVFLTLGVKIKIKKRG